MISSILAEISSVLDVRKDSNKRIELKKRASNKSLDLVDISEAAAEMGVTDLEMNALDNSVKDFEIRTLKSSSDEIFDYLDALKFEILNGKINAEELNKIKTKIRSIKKSYKTLEIKNLSDDILLRLEIEIAKAEIMSQ